MHEAQQSASVVTQFGPADWLAFFTLFVTILGGVASIVWSLSRLQSKVEELIADVSLNTGHRSQCDQDRAILSHSVSNHSQRLDRIEASLSKGGG